MHPTELLDLTNQLLKESACRLAEQVETAPDLALFAHGGEWSIGEVAAHLVAVARYHVDILNGVPSPFTDTHPAEMRRTSERLLAQVAYDGPASIAQLVVAAFEELSEATAGQADGDPVIWHWGAPLTVASVAGICLGEVVLHGYDVAAALGRPWVIDPVAAGLILGGLAPVFEWIVDADRTRKMTAAISLDLGPGVEMVARFTDGVFSLEPPGPGVDATVTSDPVTFLLVGSHRLSPYQAVALGRMQVGGARPDLALGFRGLFAYPT